MNFNIDASSLFASLICGAVGSGFAIYGKKQQKMVPMFGGLAIIAGSYFIESALIMILVSAALIAAIIWLKDRF